MKPIDDPRFAKAVLCYKDEHILLQKASALIRQADELLRQARLSHKQGNASKPSPQTHNSTMNKLRLAVHSRGS